MWAISASFKYFLMVFGAKHIYFLCKIWKSTFGQHLGNICCLNVALKSLVRQKMCKNAFLYRSLRQHLGNICCLHVDQTLPNEFFMNSRCFLHHEPLKKNKPRKNRSYWNLVIQVKFRKPTFVHHLGNTWCLNIVLPWVFTLVSPLSAPQRFVERVGTVTS